MKDKADKLTKDIFFKTPFNYDTEAESNRTGLKCLDPTLAKEEFKDDANPNVLFARYLETGLMPQRQDLPRLSDYEGIFDYQTAMNQVRAAQEAFDALPVNIRNRFDNSPQKYLEFCEDPKNEQEGRNLGLWKPEVPGPTDTSEKTPQSDPGKPKAKPGETPKTPKDLKIEDQP